MNAEQSENSFQITLNGEAHTITGDAALIALIGALKVRKGRVAVEINRTIIPKADWENCKLKPGDAVEIVNFVGGG